MSAPAMPIPRTMRTMRRLQPLALLSLLALGACGRSPQQIADGPDPLEALGAPALSTRYSVPFWAREVHGGSGLWRRAASFCQGKDLAAFPNCHAVHVADFWEHPPAFPRPHRTLSDLLEEPAPGSPPAPPSSPLLPASPHRVPRVPPSGGLP